MNRCFGWSMVMVVALWGCSPRPDEAVTPQAQGRQEIGLMSEEQQTLYALGAALANNLRELELSDTDRRFVMAGFEEVAAGENARVDVASLMPRIQSMHLQRQAAAITARREQGAKYLDEQAVKTGAVKTPTGMVYRVLEAGTGRAPAEHDVVTVHYEGTLPDGTVVDSSRKRGKPTQFRVNGVIACWKEALLQMRVGGRSVLGCPPDLAYGNGGSPPVIPPGATLTFEVELLDLSKPDDSRGS